MTSPEAHSRSTISAAIFDSVSRNSPTSSPSEAAYKPHPSTICRGAAEPAESRQIRALLLNCELEMVPGHRLTKKARRRRDDGLRRDPGCIDEENGGGLAIRRGALI